MHSTSPPRFRLRNPELVTTLMRHTGDGTRTTVRDLARRADVHASLISRLLADNRVTVSFEVATAVSRRLGVDLLVIWMPAERTDSVLNSEVVAA